MEDKKVLNDAVPELLKRAISSYIDDRWPLRAAAAAREAAAAEAGEDPINVES